MSEPTEPKWMVIANVKRETTHGTGRADVESGLKHFSPGTKVYVTRTMHDRAHVLGRHRGGSRLVSMVVELRHLENFRAKLVYDPGVLGNWDAAPLSESDAQDYLARAIAGSRWGQ